MDFKNDDDLVLLCAFRYALGRRTYIVSTIVGLILHNWDKFKIHDKELIVKEIKQFEKEEWYGGLGDHCDEEEWYKIINKYEEENKNDRF